MPEDEGPWRLFWGCRSKGVEGKPRDKQGKDNHVHRRRSAVDSTRDAG